MQRNSLLRFCSLLLLIFLCGCSLPAAREQTPAITPHAETIVPTPTIPSPTDTPAPTKTAIPTPAPTETAIPTPPVLASLPAGLLPRPLFVLANLNGITQVWKIDTLGQRTQVTYETEDIVGMDVSASDGAVAYTTRANQLYLTHPGGSVPGLVIDGAEVSDPVFSQNGRQLAYAMDGIKVFDRLTGEWTNAIFNSGAGTKYSRSYTPLGWSPDGQRILVRVQLLECNLFEFITLNGAETKSFGFGGPGMFAWSPDGRSIYYAEPAFGGACGNASGLWRIDARSGAAQALISTEMNGRIQLVGYPFTAPGGRLQYFLGQAPGQVDGIWDAPMRMVSTQMDGLSDRQGLRPDEQVFYDNYNFGEVLWAPDGSFAIVTTVTDQPPRKDAWLLKADGSQAVYLGYLGYNLHWGIP